MVNRFSLEQISEVFFAYKPDMQRYEISIRYVDDSEFPYKQSNFGGDTQNGAIERFNRILQEFGIRDGVRRENFIFNERLNTYDLSKWALERVKRDVGLSEMARADGLGEEACFEETNIEGLYKMKGKQVHYLKEGEDKFRMLYTLNRPGNLEMGGEVAFKQALTFEDKDIIRFFVISKFQGENEYIEFGDKRIKDWSLGSRNSVSQNNPPNPSM